jgi:two-component system cell cycle sensor histidine kinase PleC
MHAKSPPRRAVATPFTVPTRRSAALTVELSLLRELYGPRKPLLAGNLCAAALIAAVLWDTGVRSDLFIWALLVAGVTLMRYLLVLRFQAQQHTIDSVVFWTWAYAAGAFASGILWGASISLFPLAGIDTHDQIYVLIVAGMSAAALSGYAVSPLVFVAFLVPSTLPFAWYLFHTGGQFKATSAALYFIWLAAMVLVAYGRSRRIAEMIGAESAAADRVVRDEMERESAERSDVERARIVAQLSHELRTPLNAIVGFSEAIKHGVFGPIGNPRYSAYADNIHDSGRHLLAVIERALVDRALGSEIAAMEEGDVDLREIAEEALAMFDARSRQCGVALVLAVEEPAPSIRGNATKLKQVLINLLSNAVKFTPPGGRVSVEIEAPPGSGVVMRVADTGVGMDKDEISRALDPSAANRKRAGIDNGRGVGLLIAKWLSELHGGRLAIESTPGVGTTATVSLPRERLLLRILGVARPAA